LIDTAPRTLASTDTLFNSQPPRVDVDNSFRLHLASKETAAVGLPLNTTAATAKQKKVRGLDLILHVTMH